MFSFRLYEEKKINLIQDLYSPCENLEFNKKKVTTITDKKCNKEVKQIREKVTLEGMENKSIIDVDITPVIEKENKLNSRIIYEGQIELRFIVSNNELQVETKQAEIPFEYTIENIESGENMSTNMEIEVTNQDFIVQEGGVVTSNIDMNMNMDSYRDTNLNIMDEIETNGEREEEDYSIIMYIVKKGDTLWKIAKELGSTIDDIVRANGIEDADKIYPEQKLYIPKYRRPVVNTEEASMMNYA